MISNLTVALAYARANMPVFPCGHTKLPLITGNWLANATTDEKQIQAWWTAYPDALVGLPLKPLDAFVLDADRHGDGEDGVAYVQELFVTHGPFNGAPEVETANSGKHFYFRQPSNWKIGNKKLGHGLETRGFRPDNDGGYVIASGSKLPDGRQWRRAGTIPVIKSYMAGAIPQAPAWLLDRLREQKWKPNGGGGHQTGNREARYAEAALRNCAAELARQAQPGRNNLLNVCALKMGAMAARGWISRPAVADALYSACRVNGLAQEDGDDSVQKTLASGFAAGWARPHPDLEGRHYDSRKQSAKASDASDDAAQARRDWNDPDYSILDDRRGDLPEFPIDALSEPTRVWARRAALGAGVTVAHVAVPAIGIASSLIGTARRIKATRSWLQCATCWTAVVGFSGTGKTPGIDTIKRPLSQIERDRKKDSAELRRKHDAKAEQAKAARKRWQKQIEEAAESKQPAPEMPADADDPGKFIVPRLHISDGTIERFGELLTARPQGVLRLTDELSAMFMNMSRFSGGQDNEFWLESWNGGAYNVERIGRNLQIDHLLIGVVGGMQPDKLAQAFEVAADGMYARILFAWPPEPDFNSLNDDAEEIDPAIYNALIRLDKLAEFEDGRLVIRDIPLSAEAREGFERFRRFVHDQKDALEGREREWWAKATAHVLRLAVTLCLFAWAMGSHQEQQGPEPTAVSETYMDSAIRLVRDYFWAHARAALRQIGLSDRHLNARRILRWVKANHKDEISLRDVRRHALGERLDEEQTKRLLDGLERAGWLQKVTQPAGPKGGKPVIRWQVNPTLYSAAQTAETAET
jgi:uncharacterized protein DUF3987/bifunctional DNA primase/polymerase-like protein